MKSSKSNDEALQVIADLVAQYSMIGSDDRGATYDSMSITAMADAMRFLAAHGRFRIEAECGRRVIGRLVLNWRSA